jgi:DinB superfamily
MAYSTNERRELIQYLDKTRDDLLAVVRGLSEAQLDFQTSPKCWCIAGIVEHFVLVEDAVLARALQELTSAANPGSEMKANETDAGLLRKATDRSVKLEAPGQFHPTGKPMASSLEQFLAGRKKIVDFIQSTRLDLRHISTQTRAFGPLDGHQRFLFLAAHSARHTEQILETKSNPNFPGQ